MRIEGMAAGELLHAKIRVLEALVQAKDSEINILKECLKEIGTQINVEDISDYDFSLSNVLDPTAKVEYKRTNLFLQKAYVYTRQDNILLDKINAALRRVEETKNENSMLQILHRGDW